MSRYAPLPDSRSPRRAITHRSGFTLIELLIVVVIIAILAAIAIPKFVGTKGRAYRAMMQSDLQNMSKAQENYYYEHGAYASDAATLAPAFTPSSAVDVTIVAAGPAGWSAKETSAMTPTVCAVYFNSAPVAPATADGSIQCQ